MCGCDCEVVCIWHYGTDQSIVPFCVRTKFFDGIVCKVSMNMRIGVLGHCN